MAPVRKTPTTGNFGPLISGEDYTDKVNEEIQALWDRTFQMLDNVVGTNTITATTDPTLQAYAKNQGWVLTPQNTNSGATQINIDGKGLRAIKSPAGAALAGGELIAGVATPLFDNGSELRMLPTVVATVNVKMSIFALTKASGTNGGSSVASSRQTYPLNTTVLNEISGASLIAAGGDQFKLNLPIGTYEFDAVANLKGGNGVIFLRDETAGADLVGTGTRSDEGDAEVATLTGKFSLTVASLVSVQYRVNSAQSGFGLGSAISLGETERYGFIKLRKVT